MKRTRFSDFLFGLAGFSVSNGFFDEFISECVKEKILIFELKRTEESITGKVHFSDIDSLRRAAAKSGSELDIAERSGLPHLFFRYRKRYGIPLGLLIFTVITAVLHSVVWAIDVTPTEFIETEQILSVLEEAGAFIGAFSDAVDCKEAEYVLYNTFEDISWVNVRITGTRMFVDISEVKVKENTEEEKYTNIVASKDGEIINALIYCGTGQLYPGTAVVKGDLLISGIVNHRDGSVKFVDSEGEIFARTKNFIASRMPSVIRVGKIKKCKDIYFPIFFGLTLNSIIDVKSLNFTESRYFTDGNDVIFPLGIIRRHLYSFEQIEMELSENQAALMCFRDFAGSCLKLRRSSEIIESDIKLSVTSGAEFSGSFLCIEDIALKKEFTVEDS